jgi:hypothetical protein
MANCCAAEQDGQLLSVLLGIYTVERLWYDYFVLIYKDTEWFDPPDCNEAKVGRFERDHRIR